MALIVEDGTGKPDAESYISVADATLYLKNLGVAEAAWLALDPGPKEQALRRATNYMTQMYRTKWKGMRIISTQSLDWPRYDAIVDQYLVRSDIVPKDIANACASLALRATTATLSTDTGRLKQSVKVGPLSVDYVQGSAVQKKFTEVDNLLAPYLMGGGGSQIPVTRA